MPEPMPDLIVLIPGIGGSVLARDGLAVWEPRAGAALRAALTLGKSIRSLTCRATTRAWTTWATASRRLRCCPICM